MMADKTPTTCKQNKKQVVGVLHSYKLNKILDIIIEKTNCRARIRIKTGQFFRF